MEIVCFTLFVFVENVDDSVLRPWTSLCRVIEREYQFEAYVFSSSEHEWDGIFVGWIVKSDIEGEAIDMCLLRL